MEPIRLLFEVASIPKVLAGQVQITAHHTESYSRRVAGNNPVPGIFSASSGEYIMSIIKNLWTDTSGASAAEYALILAIVGTGIALAAVGLGGAIGNAMNKAKNCIASPVAANC